MAAKKATIINWDSSLHPRDTIGEFRNKDLKAGWHTKTDRRGRVSRFFVNEMDETYGKYSLTMGAVARPGDQFDLVSDSDGEERVHVVPTEDEELMYVSASDSRVCGVVHHDKVAPPETFSMCRYARTASPEFDPDRRDQREAAEASSYLAQTSGRADGRVYDTMAAMSAERVNAEYFENDKVPKYEFSPQELANKAVEARDYITHNFKRKDGKDYTAAQARNQEVFVYVSVNKKGEKELRIKPVQKVDEHGIPTKEEHRSPKSVKRGGSSVTRMRLGDLTRMSRAMQDDGIESVDLCITDTPSATKHAKNTRKALHFRTTSDDGNTTMWGTIEPPRAQKAVQTQKIEGRFLDKNGHASASKKRKYRKAVGERYGDVNNERSAADLHQRLYGGYVAPEDIHFDKNRKHFMVKGSHTSTVYSSHDGTVSGQFANDATGFYEIGKRKLEPMGVKPKDIRDNNNGTFSIMNADKTRALATFDGKFRQVKN